MRSSPAALMLLAAAWAAPAQAQDAEAGRRLAQQWCTGCHVIGQGEHGTDAAPSLPSIAQRNSKDQQWVKTWLASPHPPMPNLNLTRREIDDLAAYLKSLQ